MANGNTFLGHPADQVQMIKKNINETIYKSLLDLHVIKR